MPKREETEAKRGLAAHLCLVESAVMMTRLAALLLVFVPFIALATPPLEWSLQNGEDIGYRPDLDRNISVRIAPRVDRDYAFITNYNYFFELKQIASFLADWQEENPDSPDYGGMIEAEAGDLADVIQTDNTLEAIITWCRYALVFDDTLTYGDNVRRAWVYCWRYPAWQEEGESGNDYYRNHNCAWGTWATLTYEEAYGDQAHAAYAETCATYMVDHPMSFGASQAYEWINPFVTGWMAGNLYQYGEAMQNEALMDTAAGMGNRLINWFAADPETRLAEERWAMSSGTAVWGVCNSAFRADPEQGVAWIAQYGSLVDEFQPWRDAPSDGYDWDNSWNVAYANAHHAMYLISEDGQYGANFQVLTDTLLSYDTDDDGGIPATTQDPVTEDMTWVSSYLWLMGVYGVTTHLPDIDAGVLSLAVSPIKPPYHTGDSLFATCTFSNFGWADLAQVDASLTLIDPSGIEWPLSWSWSLDNAENMTVSYTWPLVDAGEYQVVASAQTVNDENPVNDTVTVSVDVLPEVEVSGRLVSLVTGEPIGGFLTADYLGDGIEPIPYDTTWADPSSGMWTLNLPQGSCLLSVSPRLPYPELQETLLVSALSNEVEITFDHVVDLVLVDDDEGEDYDTYLLDTCDTLAVEARRWDRAIGIPAAVHLLEFPLIPVLWHTGEATTEALEPAEQESLLVFLEGDGQLILSGQGMVEHCGSGVLFQEMFPVTFADNSHDHILDLDPDDKFNGGYEHIGTAGQGSANNQGSQDVLVPGTAPGVELFPFVSYAPDLVAGIRFEGGGGRRILCGFGLEGIGLPYNPEGFMPREVLVSRSLAWLSGQASVPDDVLPVPKQPVLTIMPNPSQNAVTFAYTFGGSQALFPVKIYDCAGRLVEVVKLEGEAPRAEAVYDASHLSSGLYLCTAGSARLQKLVIMR